MYNVSREYNAAIHKLYRTRRLTGTIGDVPFDDDNVLRDSFIIEHQCSSVNMVQIGSVFMAQLTCIFRGVNLDGQWQKKVITPYEGLLLENDTFEDVPLGVFTVYEANHQDEGIGITAHDNMKKLDKRFKLGSVQGKPYDILGIIAHDCHVSLAKTEQEIDALPNGTRAFTLYAENEVETYRDLLSWVAQLLGAFATFDRFGRLDIRQYGIEYEDIIDADTRYNGAVFSDFVTYYTGVSVVKIESESTYYRGLDEDDGLTYNLGANPFLQIKNLDNILDDILVGLSRINYTPFSLDKCANPAYDLGDLIVFEDGNGDGKSGCVMSYLYRYHGSYHLEGYGSNPALATARSKTDKQISGLMKQNTVANAIQYYTFTNAKELNIGSDYKEIIYIRFGSMKETIAKFEVEIKLTAESTTPQFSNSFEKIIGAIKYIFNGEEMDYHPLEAWFDGTHLLHLLYFFVIDSATMNRLSVRMNTDGAINIQRYDIHAAISGQGLVASNEWDGIIEVEDAIYPTTFATTPTPVPFFDDSVDVGLHEVIVIEVVDNVDELDIETVASPVAFAELLQINKEPISDYTWDEISEYTWDQVEDMFYW